VADQPAPGSPVVAAARSAANATITATVRYFAAARAAAGVAEERLSVAAGPKPVGAEHAWAATVGTVLDAAVERHGAGLVGVLQRCSFLLDEVAVHGTDTRVGNGQVLDVLPPFAGG
jgi:molybdopterin synthase sulfur carrier subunit